MFSSKNLSFSQPVVAKLAKNVFYPDGWSFNLFLPFKGITPTWYSEGMGNIESKKLAAS